MCSSDLLWLVRQALNPSGITVVGVARGHALVRLSVCPSFDRQVMQEIGLHADFELGT